MMKRLSVLTCASLFFVPELAMAQTVPNKLLKENNAIVAVDGFLNFTAVTQNQNTVFEKTTLPDANASRNLQHDKFNFSNDSQVYVKIGAITDSKIKYGAVVEFEADFATNGTGQGAAIDKSFLFSETKLGKFEFGNNMAANQKMKVGPAMFARATGGISGKYIEHINFPVSADSNSNVKLPRFILTPQSPIAHGGYAQGFYSRASDNNYASNDDSYGSFVRNNSAIATNGTNVGYKNGSFNQMEDATKLSYYSPRINGWQMGVSFTPDTGNNGAATVIPSLNSGYIKNVASAAVNYSQSFGNLGFAISATGEKGNFQNSNYQTAAGNNIERRDLSSYDLGLMFTYFGFTVGASYGYWGNSLAPKSGIYSCDYDSSLALASQNCSASNSKKYKGANYYTGGIAYEFGPIAASITYINSEFQKNKYQATSLGIDYRMKRGLMPYVEYTKFEFNSNKLVASDVASSSQIKDNKGSVLLAGFLLAF